MKFCEVIIKTDIALASAFIGCEILNKSVKRNFFFEKNSIALYVFCILEKDAILAAALSNMK